MTANMLMTKQGLDNLLKEKEEIEKKKIPAANKALEFAREQGDLSENSAYTAAKEQREFLSQRLDELNELIKTSVVVASPSVGVVGIGSIVTVSSGKAESVYNIVGEFESNPMERKISYKSPLGQLLMNKKVGDSVELTNENGKTTYKIIKIS